MAGAAQLPHAVDGDWVQTVTGADAEYGRDRLLVRAEWLRSVFHLPLVAEATPTTSLPAWSGYIEGRYRLQDLLLWSSVCGTGFDVVPLPGAVSEGDLTRCIADVAALSARLRKPLSARLLPVPGAKAGDMSRFTNPLLVNTRVFEV